MLLHTGKCDKFPDFHLYKYSANQGPTNGGYEGAVKWTLPRWSLPPNPDLKNTSFVDTMTSKFHLIHPQLKPATETG
jgi:hypothetical protein